MTVHMPHTGDHTLTHVEAKEATCTERGNTEYWCCSLCGKYFSTTAANDEVEFWPFTDAPGHDLIDEGQCANCDFAATMLQPGSNTVTVRAMAETGTEDMEVYKNNLYAFHSIRSGTHSLKAKTGAYLAIYDNCLNYLGSYDSPLSYYIFEGKTLYFAFIAYNEANIGDIPCEISYTWHDGDHILESQSALDATCTTDGFEVCQKCTLCGRTFDAEGNLWTEARIPALGHHMVAGECEHGCGLKATQLQIINGKIDVPAFAGNISDWDEVAANNLYYVNAPISCYSIDLSGINRRIFNNKQQLTWGHPAEADETIFFGLGSEQEIKNAKYEIYYYHNDNCQPAKHIESQNPTCTEPGYYEHYRCYCGARYSDEQCTEDCYETVIPALGHSMKDGECEHECGLKATELQLGENTVTVKQLTTDCNELADYGENLFYFNSSIDGWPTFSASTTTSVLAKTFHYDGSENYECSDYEASFGIDGVSGINTSFLGLQSQSDIATLTLMVSLGHGEEVPHNLEYHEKVDATCTAKGHEAYYQCTYCFSKFRDAEATDLIWEDNNISIPATGHNYNPEGKCESCDQVAPTLVQGVNTIEIDPQSINWTYDYEQWEYYGANIYRFHADHTGPIWCDDFEGGLFIRCFDTDHTYTSNYVEQGKDYYIGVKGNNAEGGNELTFTIYTEHNEEGGAHNPISQDAVDPTCTNSGFVAHLRCSICGIRYYLDEDNNEYNPYVEPLGHDMHDGQCSRCDLACPEIKIGHQTIDIAATENGELWNWDGNEGNRYYFIAPVSGQLTIQNEGSNEMCFSLWNSAQVCWYNNEYGYLTDNFSLDEGKTYFFCFRNRNGQAETGHPIFIFQQQNGDMNGDGKFTAEDVALLVKKVLEMSPAADPDSDPDGK